MKKSMKSAILPSVEQQLLHLGQQIRSNRLARQYTLSVMATKAGSSVATLKRIERGDPSVSIGHWVACLDVLGILRRMVDSAAVTNDPGTQALQSMQLRQRGLRKDRGHAF
jgi:hypothetical protein